MSTATRLRPTAGAADVRGLHGPTGSACSATHFGDIQVEAKPGDFVPDLFQGEHATAYQLKDRGLVVITSCGDAGVVNSVRQAQKVSGLQKVHATMPNKLVMPSTARE
jgi:7,8-dihydropterin-6-yl-methyl-4-(beta-D-ribofuranosyl)aminobenzene 5'-phosphate synthase